MIYKQKNLILTSRIGFREMKKCLDCGSTEIVKNLRTNLIFCYDCKGTKVIDI